MPSSSPSLRTPGAERRWWSRLVLPLLVLVAGGALAWALGLGQAVRVENIPRLERWFDELGGLGPVVFVLGYAVAELCFVPAMPLTVLGGIVFGPVRGTVYVSLGAIIGAALAFLAARYAMRDVVARWVTTHPRLARIDTAVAEHGWRVLMITRLVPLFPFNLQNFAYGLTGIGFWAFVGISWLCILPGTAAYALAGSAIAAGRGQPRRTIAYIGAAGILLVALSLLPRWLGRRGRLAPEPTGQTPGAGAGAPHRR